MSEPQSGEMSDVHSLVQILSICHRDFANISPPAAQTAGAAVPQSAAMICGRLRGSRFALKWLGFASEWSTQSREARIEAGRG